MIEESDDKRTDARSDISCREVGDRNEEKYLYVPCLTEIYLGVNFNYDNIDSIVEAIKKNCRDIKIFMVNPKPDAYGFERIPLKF